MVFRAQNDDLEVFTKVPRSRDVKWGQDHRTGPNRFCLKDHFISLDLDVIIFNSDFLLRPQLHIGELTWWLNLWLREWRSFEWTP